MKTQDSRVQIVALVYPRDVLAANQFPTQYLEAAVRKMIADLTDAQNSLRPAQSVLHY